jgi:hypothetical protein
MGLKIKNPKVFLVWRRFDIAFKLLYLDLVLVNKSLAIRIYAAHIKAFGLGKFSEPGNRRKSSLKVFLVDFHKIYNSIANSGFDKKKSLIAVSKDGVLVNGSHRVSSSIKANKSVAIFETNDPAPIYDFKFFYSRNVPTKFIELATQKFIDNSTNVYMAFLWPVAKNYNQSAMKIISNIIYSKSVKFTHLGAKNLLLQIYHKEKWLGSELNNFKGVNLKLASCFDQSMTVKIILFHQPSQDKVKEIKEKIRALSNYGKHSVHITDTKSEVIQLSKLLLNSNGIDFINYSKCHIFKSNEFLIREMKKFLKFNRLSSQDIIFDSGIVMQLFGLRIANDIDFLTKKKIVNFISTVKFENHKDEIKYFDCSIDDILYNPEFYFEYEGLKFTSLNTILKMKANRAELKDKIDINMINSLLGKNSSYFSFIQIQQFLLFYKTKAKINFIWMLKVLNLFNSARFLYHALKK